MMRSMFADQPYSPVTRTHGESARRVETTTLSTLSSRTSFMSLQRPSVAALASSSSFFSSSEVIHAAERHPQVLRLLAVDRVTEDAHLKTHTRDVRELHRTSETLVTLRVVVLEADLELDGLHKLARLLLRAVEDSADGIFHAVDVELAHVGRDSISAKLEP